MGLFSGLKKVAGTVTGAALGGVTGGLIGGGVDAKRAVSRNREEAAAEALRLQQERDAGELAATEARLRGSTTLGPKSFEEGLAQGRTLGMDLTGADAYAAARGQRSAEVNDILARYQKGLDGLTSAENAAITNQARGAIRADTTGALRTLAGRQAGAGVRGGAALSQLNATAQQGAANAADFERDLLIKNIDAKRTALNDYAGAVSGAEAKDKELVDQRAKIALGVGDIGQQNSALIEQILANQKASQQQALASEKAKGGKVLCSELHRQGRLDPLVYSLDGVYGAGVPIQTRVGYWMWARPLARLMRRSPLVTNLLAPGISAWAHHMAWTVSAGFMGRRSLVIATLAPAAELACFALGALRLRFGGVINGTV